MAISDHRSSQPTLDELLRLAAEAHVGGLMSGKAGIVHLHLGDGPRGLELVRQALDASELPARVFNPTHVNRRKALFAEAIAAGRARTRRSTSPHFRWTTGRMPGPPKTRWSCTWDGGLPADRVTVSSDGGGCLPLFDADGRVADMDVGAPGALASMLATLLARGQSARAGAPAVHEQRGGTACGFPGRAGSRADADADLVVLTADMRCST